MKMRSIALASLLAASALTATAEDSPKLFKRTQISDQFYSEGATFGDIGEIPGGVKYVCGCLTQPPFSFGCTSMESSYSLADDIAKEMGLVDFRVVPPAETEVVKGDVEFWADFLKEPNLAVVTARKPPVDVNVN